MTKQGCPPPHNRRYSMGDRLRAPHLRESRRGSSVGHQAAFRVGNVGVRPRLDQRLDDDRRGVAARSREAAEGDGEVERRLGLVQRVDIGETPGEAHSGIGVQVQDGEVEGGRAVAGLGHAFGVVADAQEAVEESGVAALRRPVKAGDLPVWDLFRVWGFQWKREICRFEV